MVEHISKHLKTVKFDKNSSLILVFGNVVKHYLLFLILLEMLLFQLFFNNRRILHKKGVHLYPFWGNNALFAGSPSISIENLDLHVAP